MIAPSVFVGGDVLHKWQDVPICYALYCFVAMLALLFIQETRDVSLQDLDRAEPGPASTASLHQALSD